MKKPTVDNERRIENGRLAYYKATADAAFWDEHWRTYLSPEFYAGADKGDLGWFERLFTKYLPENGRIIEAGCGLAHYVVALRARGYDAEGIEWASETVKAVLQLYPGLPVRAGDVTRIDVPGGHYSGYISLGVVEHRQEGPEPFLHEAHRVLKPGGFAFISVPYLHPLRRLKARLGLYRGRPDGLEFYQYAYGEEEFLRLLRQECFEVVDRMCYDGFKGVKDEVPPVRFLLNRPVMGLRLRRLLQSWGWAERHLGHMRLFVCRKI